MKLNCARDWSRLQASVIFLFNSDLIKVNLNIIFINVSY